MVKDWILNRLQFLKADKNGSATENFSANGLTSTNLTVDTNLIKTDSVNNRVGINKTTPAKTLDVVGNGEVTQDFTVGTSLTVGTNLAVGSSAKIDDIIELSIGGVTSGIIAVVSGGKVRTYSNAYNDAGAIKLRTTGYSDIIIHGEGSTGETHKYTFSGNAGDLIVVGPDHSRLGTDSFFLGRTRAADGASTINLISALGVTSYNAYIQKAIGADGILSIVNKGIGAFQLKTNDTVLGLSQDQNGQVKTNVTTASTSTTTGSFVSAGGVGIAGDEYLGGHLNMATGKIQYLNSIPLLGFDTTGLVVRAKIISGAIGDGSGTGTVAHGLTSPVTGGKVVGVVGGIKEANLVNFPSSSASSTVPERISMDDTNVYWYRSLTNGLYVVFAIIFYID